MSELADYDFTIHHLPGKLNNKADALSHQTDYCPLRSDNQGIIGLPDSLFQSMYSDPGEWVKAIGKITEDEVQGEWEKDSWNPGRVYLMESGPSRNEFMSQRSRE